MAIPCIANSDMDKGPEVPLWECPCPTCTRMDWDALDHDDRPSLQSWRIAGFPAEWSK